MLRLATQLIPPVLLDDPRTTQPLGRHADLRVFTDLLKKYARANPSVHVAAFTREDRSGVRVTVNDALIIPEIANALHAIQPAISARMFQAALEKAPVIEWSHSVLLQQLQAADIEIEGLDHLLDLMATRSETERIKPSSRLAYNNAEPLSRGKSTFAETLSFVRIPKRTERDGSSVLVDDDVDHVAVLKAGDNRDAARYLQNLETLYHSVTLRVFHENGRSGLAIERIPNGREGSNEKYSSYSQQSVANVLRTLYPLMTEKRAEKAGAQVDRIELTNKGLLRTLVKSGLRVEGLEALLAPAPSFIDRLKAAPEKNIGNER